MSVDAISFSAHADFPQTSEFIEKLQPPHVILVHGEATEMGRLKDALASQAAVRGEKRTFYMPRVTQAVEIPHKAQRIVKVCLTSEIGPAPAPRLLAGCHMLLLSCWQLPRMLRAERVAVSQ